MDQFSSQWTSDREDDMLAFFSQSEINYLNEYTHESLTTEIGSASQFSSMETSGKGLVIETKEETDPGPMMAGYSASHSSEWCFAALPRLDMNQVDVSGGSGGSTREAQDHHVIMERNRREKLRRLFISLAAIIPGLKKTDKASLLSDAISYVKQLETRVKMLESSYAADHAAVVSSGGIDSTDPSPAAAVRIEARRSEKTVLLRILCEKQKGVMVKVLSEVENRHLSVLCISAMPAEGSALLITITSHVEEGFAMTTKDLVKDLKAALSQHT